MANNQPVEMTLANIGNGDLMEAATLELRKIGDNIANPNVKTDAKRKLTIDITIEPDGTGQLAKISYALKTTLPGPEAGKAVATIAMAPDSNVISFWQLERPLPFDEQPAALPLRTGTTNTTK
jgi:hypothetical protein